MYAVIATGGKQYKVAPGDVLKVEKLPAAVGEFVHFPVLMAASEEAPIRVGLPHLSDVRVKAEVLSQGRAEKIKIVKFRHRKHHRKQMGHRQHYTAVKITDILENNTNGS